MANGNIQLQLVTPARRVLTQTVDELQAPGAEGSFGVRPGHTPFIAVMRAGQLVAWSGGQKQVFAVGEGFVQVADDKVLVLAETADRAEDIELAGAQAELDAETKKLLGLTAADQTAYENQRARVERAAAKVLVASGR